LAMIVNVKTNIQNVRMAFYATKTVAKKQTNVNLLKIVQTVKSVTVEFV